MAVYKVIQDVEAEDKLLGPLTLKSFVYAGVAAVLGFIIFRLLISGIGPIKYLIIIILSAPLILFAVLASPLGKDQPTEVWLLSRVRFLLKPRKRVWNQSGIVHPVSVTAPKKPQQNLTKDFSQAEVQSRLKALADTIDSRGWAVKNANLTDISSPAVINESSTDRLVKIDSIPQEKTLIEVHAKDDILDEKHNPTAKKFDRLMKDAEDERKKSLMDMVKSAFIDPKKQTPHEKAKTHQVIEEVITKAPEPHANKQHHTQKQTHITKHQTHADPKRSISANTKSPSPPPINATGPHPAAKHSPPLVTPAAQAVNMKLAQSGSDLKVSTVAKMADHLAKVRQIGPNEVEIDLH